MRKEGARSRDLAIVELAQGQHGVISSGQLRAIGVSPAGVTRRVAAARLHRIHRGVYAVGHPQLSDEGRWMAAALACGDGTVLSHISAAELWGIRRPVRRLSGGGCGSVHVTVPGSAGKKRRNGILVHRSTTLATSDCTRRNAIPVTTPARTLGDLRHLLSPAQFAAALREAEFLRLPIGGRFESGGARTEFEHRMLALCHRHRLPQPDVNAKLDRFEVDFLWSRGRLVVEADGWESHRTRSAFEQDRARDARLAVLGYRVVRFTWRQVAKDPRGVARTIRQLLRDEPQGHVAFLSDVRKESAN